MRRCSLSNSLTDESRRFGDAHLACLISSCGCLLRLKTATHMTFLIELSKSLRNITSRLKNYREPEKTSGSFSAGWQRTVASGTTAKNGARRTERGRNNPPRPVLVGRGGVDVLEEVAMKFLQRKPRLSATVLCECYASPILFEPWYQMPEAARQEFEINGPIPCQGGGVPGEWCAGCRFGKVHEPEVEE